MIDRAERAGNQLIQLEHHLTGTNYEDGREPSQMETQPAEKADRILANFLDRLVCRLT